MPKPDYKESQLRVKAIVALALEDRKARQERIQKKISELKTQAEEKTHA